MVGAFVGVFVPESAVGGSTGGDCPPLAAEGATVAFPRLALATSSPLIRSERNAATPPITKRNKHPRTPMIIHSLFLRPRPLFSCTVLPSTAASGASSAAAKGMVASRSCDSSVISESVNCSTPGINRLVLLLALDLESFPPYKSSLLSPPWL